MTDRVKVRNVVSTITDGVALIEANDSVGRYYYRYVTASKERIEKLVKEIETKGDIDPSLWDYHVPYGSEAWIIDGYEERAIEDERYGDY